MANQIVSRLDNTFLTQYTNVSSQTSSTARVGIVAPAFPTIDTAHEWNIAQRMSTRSTVTARPHDFPLSVAHAAVLVIDMQCDFLDPDGGCPRLLQISPEILAGVREIIPRIADLLNWARSHGLKVIYTREASRPDLSDLCESKRQRYENAGYPVGTSGPLGRLLIRGESGCAVIPELTPQPGDLEWDKPAQSAFIGTDLEASLRARGISDLLLTGVTTQCCVLATYRHAADLGFFPLLLEDCCAAFDRLDHQAAIDVLTSEGGAVGWVTTSDQLWTKTLTNRGETDEE